MSSFVNFLKNLLSGVFSLVGGCLTPKRLRMRSHLHLRHVKPVTLAIFWSLTRLQAMAVRLLPLRRVS